MLSKERKKIENLIYVLYHFKLLNTAHAKKSLIAATYRRSPSQQLLQKKKKSLFEEDENLNWGR